LKYPVNHYDFFQCLVKSTNDLKFKHAAEAWLSVLYNILYLCTIMPAYGNKRVIRICKSRNRQSTKKTNNCWKIFIRKHSNLNTSYIYHLLYKGCTQDNLWHIVELLHSLTLKLYRNGFDLVSESFKKNLKIPKG
jgi:hypothetical protein